MMLQPYNITETCLCCVVIGAGVYIKTEHALHTASNSGWAFTNIPQESTVSHTHPHCHYL